MVLLLVILDYVLYAIVIYLLYKNYTQYIEVVRTNGRLERALDEAIKSEQVHRDFLTDHKRDLEQMFDEKVKILTPKGSN